MEHTVGVIKEIDGLGRLVIPKELRARFALSDRVGLVATESGILIRNPSYKLIKLIETEFSDNKSHKTKRAEERLPVLTEK